MSLGEHVEPIPKAGVPLLRDLRRLGTLEILSRLRRFLFGDEVVVLRDFEEVVRSLSSPNPFSERVELRPRRLLIRQYARDHASPKSFQSYRRRKRGRRPDADAQEPDGARTPSGTHRIATGAKRVPPAAARVSLARSRSVGNQATLEVWRQRDAPLLVQDLDLEAPCARVRISLEQVAPAILRPTEADSTLEL